MAAWARQRLAANVRPDAASLDKNTIIVRIPMMKRREITQT